MDTKTPDFIPADEFVPDAANRAPASVSFPTLEVLAPETAKAETPDFIPANEFVPDKEPPSHAPKDVRQAYEQKAVAKEPAPDFIPADEFVPDAEKYGSEGQIALGLAEKFAKGVFPSPLVTGLERAVGVSPEEMKAREEYLGGYGTAAEVAGFTAGMFVPFGYGKLLGKVGEAALKGAGFAGEAATLGEKVARGIVSQVPEMAAFGAVNEIDKYLMKKPQTASSVIADITLNGVLGGAFGAAAPVVGAGLAKTPIGPMAGKAAESLKNLFRRTRALADGYEITPIIRKFLKTYGHVPEETIDSYIKERQKVLAMPEYMEVHEVMSENLTKIHERLADAKIGVKEAAQEFKTATDKAFESIKAQKKDAKLAREAAEDMLAQQVVRIEKELHQEVVENAAPEIFQALEELQTTRNVLSAGAQKILENTPGGTPVKPIIDALNEMIAGRKGAVDFDTAKELQKYKKDLLTQYKKEIPYKNVKSVLQKLGSKGSWNRFNTPQANETARYFNNLYKLLNKEVKDQIPEYAKEMLPTSEATELFENFKNINELSDVQKLALNLTNKTNYVKWMPLLKQLEQQTGRNFVGQLEKYINPEYLEKLEQSLPEAAKLSTLRDMEESLKLLVEGKIPQKAARESEEFAKLRRAGKEKKEAEQAVLGLRGVTPGNIDAVMKRAMKGNRIAIKQLENIGYMMVPIGDTYKAFSIPEVLRLLKVRESFEKGAKNGSRNVLAYQTLGRLGGTALGGITGFLGFPEHSILGATSLSAVGERLGNAIGAAADYEAPSWVKWYLDKQLNKHGELSTIIGEKSPDDMKTLFINMFGDKLEQFQSVDPSKLKATADFIEKQRMGQEKIKDGAKYLLGPFKVLPKEFFPDAKKAKETDKKAKELQENPQKIIDLTSGIQNLPEYSAQLTGDVSRLVGLINQYRPQTMPAGLFDKPIEPTAEQKRTFQIGLEFADQPLTIYSRIKNGQLLPSDVQMFQTLHPEIYSEMQKSILDALLENQENNKKIPYQMRQSLSLFMGMELDSSLTAQSIQAAQSVFALQKSQMQNAMGGAPASKTKAISKASENYETPMQSLEQRKQRA